MVSDSATADENDSLEKIREHRQKDFDAYLRTRTPEREFAENLQKVGVCFYSWGSVANGWNFPGLTREDVDHWVVAEHVAVVAYWKDDPISILGPTEPFDQMVEFLRSYNLLALDHLRKMQPEANLVR